MTGWTDHNSRFGRCEMIGHHGNERPKTHVVKWPWGAVWDVGNRPIRLRQYMCAQHAREVVTYQRSVGLDVRTYRYRRLP